MNQINELIERIKGITPETAVDILIAIGIILIFKILSASVAYIIIKMFNLKKNKKEIKQNSFYKPIKWFIVLMGVYIAIYILKIPEEIMQKVNKLFRIATILLVANGFANIINIQSSVFTKIKEKFHTDDTLVNFISKVVKTIVYVIAGFIVIAEIGYDLSGLVAGLGLGGVVIALAAQDIAKNLFGGFAIIMDKPFIVGDVIEMPQGKGTVEDISFRSTKIRTVENTVITIPNSTLSNEAVTNYSKIEKRRYNFNLGIDMDTKIEKIKQLEEKIGLILQSHPNIIQDSINVYIDTIKDDSINISISLYTDVIEYADYMQVREEINCSIMELVEVEKIELAYPTQSIVIKK